MCVCVCVCVRAYTHACASACMRVFMRLRKRLPARACKLQIEASHAQLKILSSKVFSSSLKRMKAI